MATYKISLSGSSAIVVLTRIRQDTYGFLQKRNLDMNDYVTDWDNEMGMPDYMKPFPSEGWWHLDEGYHDVGVEGILFDENNNLDVEDETFNTVWDSELNKNALINKIRGIKVSSKNDVDDFTNGSVVFVGEIYEGSTYTYEVETSEKFDPKKLTIEYSIVSGNKIVSSIDYVGGEIINQDSDTTNKGTYLRIEISNGKKPKPLHSFKLSELTPWFNQDLYPIRNGIYEVLKCDEEIKPVLLKWKDSKFYRQDEKREYEKNWNVISTKLIDIEVPFHDIVSWRGLTKKS
jgi:hypothetical protein